MQKVNLTNKKTNILSNIITQISSYYSKNEMIDAIYIICYNNKKAEEKFIRKNNNVPTIEILLAVNSIIDKKELTSLDKARKIIYDMTGVYIDIKTAFSKNYYLYGSHKRELLACQDLANGTLLFDRTGTLSRLKKELVERKYYFTELINKPYENLIEFEPPLKLKKIKN